MELRYHTTLFSNSPGYGLLKSELDRLGVPYTIKSLGSMHDEEHFALKCVLPETHPKLEEVEDFVLRHHLPWTGRLFYDTEDIKEAEWCYASPGEHQYPQPEDTYIEDTFDISNYCPFCGVGGHQKAPFRLKKDFKQKRLGFLGLHWEYDKLFVRPWVRELWEAEELTGLEFLHPVNHRSNAPIENVCQALIVDEALAGLIQDNLQEDVCSKATQRGVKRTTGFAFGIRQPLDDFQFCGRRKYHYPLLVPLKFERDKLAGLPDVVYSQEYFGGGYAANRLILVRQRFVHFVLKQKIRGLLFTPLELN